MIEFQNVSFSYGQDLILENVSFKLEPNSFTGIIGPNGGGKTTLLKLILGFLSPKSGKVFVEDPNPAYVPQSSSFDRQFPLSVLELVSQGLLHEKIWREKALETLAQVGLESFANSAFSSLSGGQLQRALIARALVSKPKLLLLDEPTASLDPKAQEDILSLIENLKGQITILMVSHDLNTIVKGVDHILCVQRSVTVGLPKQMCEHFALGLYHKPISEEAE